MNRYRILKRWDDEIADWCYRLQILNKFGTEYESTVYSGDSEWADKEAQHYECEIVEEALD